VDEILRRQVPCRVVRRVHVDFHAVLRIRWLPIQHNRVVRDIDGDVEQAAPAIEADRKPRRQALRIGRFERVPFNFLRPVGEVAVDDDARHRRHDNMRPGVRQERRGNRQRQKQPLVQHRRGG